MQIRHVLATVTGSARKFCIGLTCIAGLPIREAGFFTPDKVAVIAPQVIHWGSRPEQQVVTATLADLPERAAGMAQPALIVIGQVVSLREVVGWAESRPLWGRRVLIAHAGEGGEEEAEQVREQGGEVWLFPRRPGGPHAHEAELLWHELTAGPIQRVWPINDGAERLLVDLLSNDVLSRVPEAAAARQPR